MHFTDYAYGPNHVVTREDLTADLFDHAENGDATVGLFRIVRDFATAGETCGEVNRDGHILAEIPNTCPEIFGNGTSIDRANRKCIDGGELGILTPYITDLTPHGSGMAVDLTDLLGDGEELDALEVEDALERVAHLREYPVLDEEVWCELEHDENIENFKDYGAEDLGILRDGETFKDGDFSIPLAILVGQWHTGTDDAPNWEARTEELLIAEHTGHDTSFVMEPGDLDRAREAVSAYIVAAD